MATAATDTFRVRGSRAGLFPGSPARKGYLFVLCGQPTDVGEARTARLHAASGKPGRHIADSRELTGPFGEPPGRPRRQRHIRETPVHCFNLPHACVPNRKGNSYNFVPLVARFCLARIRSGVCKPITRIYMPRHNQALMHCRLSLGTTRQATLLPRLILI